MTSGEIIRRLNDGTFLSEKAEMLSAEQEELSSRLKDLLERFGKAFGEGRDLSVFSVKSNMILSDYSWAPLSYQYITCAFS